MIYETYTKEELIHILNGRDKRIAKATHEMDVYKNAFENMIRIVSGLSSICEDVFMKMVIEVAGEQEDEVKELLK